MSLHFSKGTASVGFGDQILRMMAEDASDYKAFVDAVIQSCNEAIHQPPLPEELRKIEEVCDRIWNSDGDFFPAISDIHGKCLVEHVGKGVVHIHDRYRNYIISDYIEEHPWKCPPMLDQVYIFVDPNDEQFD